jgi:hypothetical protein
MCAQLIKAGGALLDTIIWILSQEFSVKSRTGPVPGLSRTEITTDEFVLPVTAGAFIYIATIGIFEISPKDTRAEFKKMVFQLLVMGLGVTLMFLV